MMNLIALAFLVSYFGAVIVLVPEQHVTQADGQGYESYKPSSLFRSAKKSAQNAVCDQEPCPTSMDQIKDTLHQGYGKTVDNMESAKDSVKETATGVYQQAKHGVQDKAGQAKEGVQATGSRAKHDTYETAQQAKQGVQDKAGQVKHGVQETSGKVTPHIPSAEDVKQGIYEAGERVTSHIPSKEEAVSYIPGIETGREAADVLKQKVGEAKDRVVSYGEYSDRDSLESLRKKLEDVRQQVASHMQGKEKDASYWSFVGMEKMLDEASSYIPRKESATSYIPGKDSVEGIKNTLQEKTQGVQDKAGEIGESTRNTAQETAQGLQDKAHAAGGRDGKLGGVFHGLKERFTGGKKGVRDGNSPLERKVHDLCNWYDGGVRTSKGAERMPMLDVAATRESYEYLMENALGSIEQAHEVFDRAAEEEAVGEWREKYVYLADSAKGALAAAKDVFERAVTAAGGSVTGHLASHRVSSFGKSSNMTKLKKAVIHSKEKLAATLRSSLRTLYLATFSAVYGLSLWMTFLSGYLLSRCLPRQQLGIVQSKLFPIYLYLLSGCITLCAVSHAVLHPWRSADRSEHWQYANFLLCLGLALFNLLVLEPRATKMMFEKLKFEKEEGRGQSVEEMTDQVVKTRPTTDEVAKTRPTTISQPRTTTVDEKFKGLHQLASCVNVAIVAGLTWHLWYLSNRLVV